MSDSKRHTPFPVIPGTDEYEALSFLVSNRGDEFAPSEIAAQMDISETIASTALTHLFEKEIIECSQGTYYVDLDDAKELQYRLESIDATERLHDAAPNDDIYAVTDWEEKLNLR